MFSFGGISSVSITCLRFVVCRHCTILSGTSEALSLWLTCNCHRPSAVKPPPITQYTHKHTQIDTRLTQIRHTISQWFPNVRGGIGRSSWGETRGFGASSASLEFLGGPPEKLVLQISGHHRDSNVICWDLRQRSTSTGIFYLRICTHVLIQFDDTVLTASWYCFPGRLLSHASVFW